MARACAGSLGLGLALLLLRHRGPGEGFTVQLHCMHRSAWAVLVLEPYTTMICNTPSSSHSGPVVEKPRLIRGHKFRSTRRRRRCSRPARPLPPDSTLLPENPQPTMSSTTTSVTHPDGTVISCTTSSSAAATTEPMCDRCTSPHPPPASSHIAA